MRHLDISEARKQFNRLDDLLAESPVIVITRHARPAFATVDSEYLDTLLDTIDIMARPESHRLFLQSLDDIRAGRVHDHESVKRELDTPTPQPVKEGM